MHIRELPDVDGFFETRHSFEQFGARGVCDTPDGLARLSLLPLVLVVLDELRAARRAIFDTVVRAIDPAIINEVTAGKSALVPRTAAEQCQRRQQRESEREAESYQRNHVHV